VRLHFTPAEATFYGTIRDDGRKARNQLQALLLQGGAAEYRERAARRKAEVRCPPACFMSGRVSRVHLAVVEPCR
jgi:hypothetical protein